MALVQPFICSILRIRCWRFLSPSTSRVRRHAANRPASCAISRLNAAMYISLFRLPVWIILLYFSGHGRMGKLRQNTPCCAAWAKGLKRAGPCAVGPPSLHPSKAALSSGLPGADRKPAYSAKSSGEKPGSLGARFGIRRKGSYR